MWAMLVPLNVGGHECGMLHMKRDGLRSKWPDDGFRDRIRAACRIADRVRFDEEMWKELSEKYAEAGVNTIILTLADAVVYPSHPEMAVKGSWPVEKLVDELERLRRMGFEVLPKLNFSTTYDAWLKEYNRMVSTPEYYAVCSDVIRDVCGIFGSPRLFHIGFDEEQVRNHRCEPIAIARQGELWWHDLRFFVQEVEKNGARAWMWVDHIVKDAERTGVYANLPKSVLVSPWYYQDVFDSGKTWQVKVMHDLAAHGYEMVPCGSNHYFTENSMELLVSYCEGHFDRSLVPGYLCAPWVPMSSYFRDRLIRSADDLRNARRLVEG